MTQAQKVVIYTDGSSRGNPGRGGYGIVMMYGSKKKELAQGFRLTTNNRMELLAVIVALEQMKKENLDIDIYSDSSYVVNAIEKKWIWNWIKNGFKGKKNEDLWRRFIAMYPKNNIRLIWVKGHSSNLHNNRCDELATAAADSSHLLIDKGYEEAQNDSLF